ncbi:MAG: UDP-N-acetylmuramoyl-L-alanyl-D-glutamate--2,6-diaminopimelate ligase [Candidatus Improbicoccus devescovinae]|nr:MAG: UDP-N-acetylmuramoyl-L-alanyl-D-glutamate--2,6-diaminopimelate ligase [Candidatus Improbicoccus devescovinae]
MYKGDHVRLGNIICGLDGIESRHFGISSYDEFENQEVLDICYDSRSVTPGCMFVCLMGVNFDSHIYAQDAVTKGASVIICSEYVNVPNYVKVKNTRKALAIISANFWGHPEQELRLIAVTGTKGKTTTAKIIKDCIIEAGKKCALIGTLGMLRGEELISTKNTTPESYEIYAFLRGCCSGNYEYVVIEASSLGLKNYRLWGLTFECSVFCNFSRDHIASGEHESLDDYFNSKLILFENSHNVFLNKDDLLFEKIKDFCVGQNCEVITYGIRNAQCDFKAENIEFLASKSKLGMKFELNSKKIIIGLPGEFNIYNALSALAVCEYLNINYKIICTVLENFTVKGRAEIIENNSDFTVLIDYAHNASSLENILVTLRKYNFNRLITLFGCGGNRPKERRFSMGEVSGKLSDLTVITTDNPRNEPFMDIIQDIETGVKKYSTNYQIIPDRIEAINFCLNIAKTNDVILLAGKGHEVYQEINSVTYELDERKIVNDFFEKL